MNDDRENPGLPPVGTFGKRADAVLAGFDALRRANPCPDDVGGHQIFEDRRHLCCLVCDGFDDSLPEECPGRRLTMAERWLVRDGQLDFRRSARVPHVVEAWRPVVRRSLLKRIGEAIWRGLQK